MMAAPILVSSIVESISIYLNDDILVSDAISLEDKLTIVDNAIKHLEAVRDRLNKSNGETE